ncbi:Acetylcholinesterase [Holothuria leucospilota]|uniref:Carboxylic ester hydrolase n=1 Tax=Holothuria leucospilota TaxID=206669 RepID=A0A9Q1BSH5_HOLLE|nr:Acetylcholinesterase [Holothuria leucospilota]
MTNLASVMVSFLSSYFICGATQPTATLNDGTILLGVSESFNSDLLPVNGKIESFYGIPYAEAPIGPLRFKPSVPKMQMESPFDASKVGRSCMQPDPATHGIRMVNEDFSEDCLFLDVIVPKSTVSPIILLLVLSFIPLFFVHTFISSPERAPVFVWIHGGGFTIGAGEMSRGTFLTFAAYSNIIIVTFNYRLGPFGFLTTDNGLIPGNIGLMDQQLALKWVNKNIKAFGGDPDKVTIGGVSAGSASVAFHSLSPGSKGLFRYGIMESGSPFDPWITYRHGEEARLEVRTLSKLIGCSPENVEDDAELLDCLINVPARDIIENICMIGQELGNPFFPPPGPTVDGVFLPKDVSSIIEEGTLNGESYIVGTNADEGTLLLLTLFPDKDVKPVVNSTMLSSVLSSYLGDIPDPIVLDLIKTIYTVDPIDLTDQKRDNFFHEATQYLGDLMFTCGASTYSRLASLTKSVYRYTMTFVPTNNFLDIKWAGAAHGDEVQYVLGGPFQEWAVHRTTDEEREMSRKVMQYWINFMKTGDPNTPGKGNKWSVPEWSKFTITDEVFKDLTPQMGNRYMKKRECYFIEKVLPQLKESLKKLQKLKRNDFKKGGRLWGEFKSFEQRIILKGRKICYYDILI